MSRPGGEGRGGDGLGPGADGGSIAGLNARIAILEQINRVLMDRVERSNSTAGSSYALFESNIAMQGVIAERTGELERINATLSDEISVRRATQRYLELARDQAEAASRAKSEFLANMSHEIRTPMAAILGYAELAAEDLRDPQRAAAHLEVIRRNGEHLLAIINDILDLSKLDAGRLKPESEPTDLGALCLGVGEILLVSAEGKGLRLTVDVDESARVVVMTDAKRARQILFNLVGNAVKFTDQGSVSVRASYDAASRTATVEVTDTGVGIDAADLATIFEPFQQADGSATRRHGGTGLGLSIARRMARLLGGDIRMASRRGVGSVFTLTVRAPVADAPAAADGCSEEPGPGRYAGVAGGVTGAALPLRGMRVLLVEDGPDNQRLLGFILRRAGASVEMAGDGRVAVAMVDASAAAFDVIVMDMQMPEMDGYEATRRLKADGCPSPIIALTAHAMAGDREKCMAAGCDAYLTKPVDRGALLETCVRLAGGGSGGTALRAA